MKKKFFASVFASFFLVGCAIPGPRQSDLDAWQGVPVRYLDTHPFFLTMPVTKTFTEDGIEIRRYVREQTGRSCTMIGYSMACDDEQRACHAIFYIKDRHVLEMKVVSSGRVCRTNETMRPGGM